MAYLFAVYFVGGAILGVIDISFSVVILEEAEVDYTIVKIKKRISGYRLERSIRGIAYCNASVEYSICILTAEEKIKLSFILKNLRRPAVLLSPRSLRELEYKLGFAPRKKIF